MTDKALTTSMADDQRALALMQAVGFDKLSPAQRELALAIAGRYGLDPMLKHIVMIEGRPYITRDGLLHVAHRSEKLDGIEVTEPVIKDEYWTASASVYRKDMSRPFTYSGRYPVKGQNAKFGPEMAVKVAEVMALRRAFDVAAPVIEERWDIAVPEVVDEVPAPPASLSERVAERAATIEPEARTAVVVQRAEYVNDVAPPEALERPETPDEEASGTSVHPDAALDWEDFKALVTDDGFDMGFVRGVAKRLYPDGGRLSSLTGAQRAKLYAELLDLSKTVDEALAEQTPDVVVPEPVSDPRAVPTVTSGTVTLCGAKSTFSDAVCTMDSGHTGPHRAGTRESWA